MKKFFANFKHKDILYSTLLILVAALAYLPFIKRMGFYGDDWYLVFDAHTQGAGFFTAVFSGDRPGRAYLMRLLYTIFGDHLIYYHLSAFLLRSLGGLAFYWTLNRVWQENKAANFLMALFFLVYPGFLMQVQPFDYQSHILSICLAMISIALTVWAVTAKSTLWKASSALAALLTGWGYLALIEFHIGLEFLRLLFVVILFLQENNQSGRRRIFTPVLRWLPFSIIPLGYLFWRTVFFHNTRAATDVGVQLGVFFQAPFRVGAQWLVDTLYGVFNTLFSAWVVPFYDNVILGGFHPSENLLILAAGILGLALLLFGLFVLGDLSGERISASGWARQALWTGLAATFAGVLPVIVTNRTVDFFSSRYTMASVPGAVMLIVAGISLLRLPCVRSGLVGLLLFISVAVHTGNALNHVHQADSLRDFWWQVSWRAPSIDKGTNLVAVYSSMQTPANYDIWGPANLIYFPEKQVEIPIKIQLPASVLSRDNVTGIIAGGEGRDKDQRGNFVSEDFSAVLLITQPAPENCVRIIDGELPELSSADKYEIMLLAPYSLIGNVNLADTAPVLPEVIFGPEPAHGWCYYYEKAALASQMGDWDQAILLGEQAAAKGLQPADPVEWLPFLRAYVATGQMEQLERYRDQMNASPFLRTQTCSVLEHTARDTWPADLAIQNDIKKSFCE